jgi:hypothetical protein
VFWQITLAQNQKVRKTPHQNMAGRFYFPIQTKAAALK